jgi:hypothetical protein
MEAQRVSCEVRTECSKTIQRNFKVTLEQTLTQTSTSSLPGIGLLISSVLRQTEALSTEASRKLN